MAETEDLKYETQDFSPRAIRWFTAGLAVLTVIVLISMGWLLWALSSRLVPGQAIVTPQGPPPDVSPAPNLQVASSRDMAELRASEDAQLQSYGWVDRQAGIAAIPIKRAMALLAERGMSEKRAEKKADTKEQP
jgi:hypothetical protein